jgi:hypothetical protein
VAELLRRIESIVQSKIRNPVRSIPSLDDFVKEASFVSLSPQSRSKYIECLRFRNVGWGYTNGCIAYFEEVHPIYPFLNRTTFEDKARSPQLTDLLSADNAWCALYHAVLSLGSLYHDCGSFDAFSGTAWDIFRISLSLFSRIVFGKRTLAAAQA